MGCGTMNEGIEIATRMLIADVRKRCEDHIKFLKILQTLKSKYPDLFQFFLVHSFLGVPFVQVIKDLLKDQEEEEGKRLKKDFEVIIKAMEGQ